MFIFVNNKFYTEKNAKISVFDRGFLYGDGVFETMRSYEGAGVFLLGKHLERLRRSAQLIGLYIPWSDKYLAGRLCRALKVNKLKDAYIRLAISRATGPLGLSTGGCGKPTLVIMAGSSKKYPPDCYNKGVTIGISRVRRNHPLCLDPEIKSANFLNNILAKMNLVKEPTPPQIRWAGKVGNYKKQIVFEAIMLNLEGFVAEGTVSNIFMVKKGVLKTPSVKCGILPGITRETVISLAKKCGIRVSECSLGIKDLLGADECFLTNTSIGIMPVRKVWNRIIRNCPGQVTSLLQNKYKQMIINSTNKL